MSLWAWQSLFRMKSKQWSLWGIRVETFSIPHLHQWPGEGNEQLNLSLGMLLSTWIECYVKGKELQKEFREPTEQTKNRQEKKKKGKKTAMKRRHKKLFFHGVTFLYAHFLCTAYSSHLKDAVESETEWQKEHQKEPQCHRVQLHCSSRLS